MRDPYIRCGVWSDDDVPVSIIGRWGLSSLSDIVSFPCVGFWSTGFDEVENKAVNSRIDWLCKSGAVEVNEMEIMFHRATRFERI